MEVLLIQWNLSKLDTIQESVLDSEVSSFQSVLCMKIWYNIIRNWKNVQFIEVSSVQGCPPLGGSTVDKLNKGHHYRQVVFRCCIHALY